MKKNFNVFLGYFKSIIKSIVSEDFFGIASEVAYMLTIGIFPFLIFITAIFGFIGKKFFIDKIIVFLSAISPDEVITIIQTFLKEIILFDKGGIVAVFGFFATFFIASNLISSIIKGLNRANGVKETRSFIHVRILSFIMILVNIIFLFISVNLVILGNIIVEFLSGYVNIPISYETIFITARFPVAFIFLFIMACINYYVLPSIDFSVQRKSVVPGALFFCTFWLLGSWLFSLYVEALGTYNKVYGTLGAFVVFMVWLYYTALVILIGGEINAKILNKFNTSLEEQLCQ